MPGPYCTVERKESGRDSSFGANSIEAVGQFVSQWVGNEHVNYEFSSALLKQVCSSQHR